MNILNSTTTSLASPKTMGPGSPLQTSPVVHRSLDIHLHSKRSKECLKWGSVNIVILSIILFDISNKCPYAFSKWYYLEYTAAVILGCSVLYYFSKYFYYLFSLEPIRGNEAQRKLLTFDLDDNSFITGTPVSKKQQNSSITPGNISSLSWNDSFNETNNITAASPGWIYNQGSPLQSMNFSQNYSINSSMNNSNASPNKSGPFTTLKKFANKSNLIVDEKGLQSYLKEVSMEEKKNISTTDGMNASGSTINSFWNSYKLGDMSNLLKTSVYQLSPSAATAPNKQVLKDEANLFNTKDIDVSCSDVLKKVSSVQLSAYVANLRMWISLTVLQRIVNEMNVIDHSFKTRGFSDIQIGSIGLERLKKTAENQQLVTLYIPKLPLLIPFLDMSTNQEYLVQRIKDLSKGSCIADYRWNSGSAYKGLNWDEHLPTDSSIIFHLFCTYMDSQLRPLPQPGGRPFYNRYVVIGDKKSPKETLAEVKNKAKCAILCTNPLKPIFNFISDEKIHNCAHDRNNLFYVIIQFLIYMKNSQESSLESINLGKSGINLLCVIEDS